MNIGVNWDVKLRQYKHGSNTTGDLSTYAYVNTLYQSRMNFRVSDPYLSFTKKRSIKVRKNAKIRNRYNQVPHLTQDTIEKSDINTRKHHIQENQEASPFPAGDHNSARNRQDNMIVIFTDHTHLLFIIYPTKKETHHYDFPIKISF